MIMKPNENYELDIEGLTMFYLWLNFWWIGFISNEWLQNKISTYYVNKAKRNLKKFHKFVHWVNNYVDKQLKDEQNIHI